MIDYFGSIKKKKKLFTSCRRQNSKVTQQSPPAGQEGDPRLLASRRGQAERGSQVWLETPIQLALSYSKGRWLRWAWLNQGACEGGVGPPLRARHSLLPAGRNPPRSGAKGSLQGSRATLDWGPESHSYPRWIRPTTPVDAEVNPCPAKTPDVNTVPTPDEEAPSIGANWAGLRSWLTETGDKNTALSEATKSVAICYTATMHTLKPPATHIFIFFSVFPPPHPGSPLYGDIPPSTGGQRTQQDLFIASWCSSADSDTEPSCAKHHSGLTVTWGNYLLLINGKTEAHKEVIHLSKVTKS